jgi:uncharacterized protein YprB with RNaseH-like and TPR domain
MSADELRRSLEALNRQRARERPAPVRSMPARRGAPVLPIDRAVPGRVVETPAGQYWHVHTTLSPSDRAGGHVAGRLRHLIDAGQHRLPVEQAHPDLAAAAGGPSDGLCFADIETCGFAGSMIFLVGIMRADGERLVFEQFLARDYGEEPAILAATAERLAAAKVLVTFNGKSFDYPCLVDRAAVHRVALDGGHLAHCDLLHEARRTWKDLVPDCRLITLERCLCGRRREDDIPGSEIPEAYHRFVKTGHAGVLQRVMQHNLLDLLTLAELLAMLLGGGLRRGR